MAVTRKCNCGKNSMTFKHLSETDLANGWECSKCAKNLTATITKDSITMPANIAESTSAWETSETKLTKTKISSETKRRGRPKKTTEKSS